ncbi:MAG TPA: hypothetical protein VFP34_18175 [Microlunatus sp.]|nr:hypothetical protein [Microlunatus sp.]
MTNPRYPTDPPHATDGPTAAPTPVTTGTGVTASGPEFTTPEFSERDFSSEFGEADLPSRDRTIVTGIQEPPLGATRAGTGDIAPGGAGNNGATDTKDAVKNEAAAMKDTAVSAGADVAHTAKEQAQNVATEAGVQAKNLAHQVRAEVADQASTQLSRVADSLHSLSKELGSMASTSDQHGPMTDLVHQASRKGGQLAHWLENREPSDVLSEVTLFARRRPFAFLSLCFAAGVLAGRVTRGGIAANTSLDSPSDAHRAIATPTSLESTGGPTSAGTVSGTQVPSTVPPRVTPGVPAGAAPLGPDADPAGPLTYPTTRGPVR